MLKLFIDTCYENASPLKWEQNEDGVYRGMSRFNIRGIDLNRGWGSATTSSLA